MLYMYALPGSGQVFLYCSIRRDPVREQDPGPWPEVDPATPPAAPVRVAGASYPYP